MREHLADSHLTRKRHEHLYEEKAKKTDQFSEKVQEYYSLRCVPQVLGPVYDTIEQALRIHLEEVNSANDNPIIDAAKEQVFHGGNFHGDYISLENDKLRLVVAKMSMLAERQLNYLLNPNLNNILPAFVNLSRLGLNFGMQGAQFAAVSTTAENQMLSNSMYVHSIPNNNDNQDIVSMGANSALLTRKVIDNAFEVLSVEIATIVQALYYLKVNEKLSSPSLRKFEILKKLLPALKEDQPIYKELQAITEYLKKTRRVLMKFALVTGGSRGLGRAICLQLARENQYHILLNYHSNDSAAGEVQKEIEASGLRCELLKFDVSDPDAVGATMEEWKKRIPMP